MHARQIPRLGGIAVVVAFYAPLALFTIAGGRLGATFVADPMLILGLAVGGVAVATLGVVDDVRGVRAVHKLWMQVAAAAVAYAVGFRIDAVTLPLIGKLEMGVFAAPVTVLWIVAITNAVNLIDGLDGLAGGIAFLACVSNFVVGYLHGSPVVVFLSAALGGAVLGFLMYNFNPASIFMGDSGSMFLGYALATTSLLGSSVKSSTTVAILVPVVALGLPIMDTLLSMVRRFLERRPLFSADRGHIHHRLLDLGLTHRRAVLILYGLSILFTVTAIALAVGRNWEVGGALVAMSLVVVGMVRSVGYFDQFWLRKSQRVRMRSKTTESLRGAVPEVLTRLRGAASPAAARASLQRFVEDAGLKECVLESGSGGSLEIFRLTAAPVSVHDRDIVWANYPLAKLHPPGRIRFAWRSDEGDVSPYADILLQLVADGWERCMNEQTGATELRQRRPSAAQSVG